MSAIVGTTPAAIPNDDRMTRVPQSAPKLESALRFARILANVTAQTAAVPSLASRRSAETLILGPTACEVLTYPSHFKFSPGMAILLTQCATEVRFRMGSIVEDNVSYKERDAITQLRR